MEQVNSFSKIIQHGILSWKKCPQRLQKANQGSSISLSIKSKIDTSLARNFMFILIVIYRNEKEFTNVN